MTVSRPPLPDQAERDRFCTQLETNFSVIAPAGVGKTTSIVDRVVAIAQADRSRLEDPVLPSLVVVTYTKKAADEMFSRVRIALDETRPHPDVHAHLAQAFFGTIHSFCQRLLAAAGPLCGFPGEAEIATDRRALWERFRREEGDRFPRPDRALARAFALHGQWEDVLTLAEQWPAAAPTELPLPPPPPPIDCSAVLGLEGKGRGKANLVACQERLREWEIEYERQRAAEEPLPCPEPVRSGKAQALVAAWKAVFGPLRSWRAEATRYLAGRVAADFARYRRRTGQLTFDDLIELARRLLEDPEARRRLRQRAWRVILDEAQDTDPEQFIVLTELTRAPDAGGCWLRGADDGPQPGHFCMVGDPQQSIYSDRADLGQYLHAHHRLLEGGGQEATFSVTMRCPRTVVKALNESFPRILSVEGTDCRQVAYVPLRHPEDARTGQVVRLSLPPPDGESKAVSAVREEAYAGAFADWLAQHRAEDFGARSWAGVAVLCPRNGWLDALGQALQARGLPVQQLSRRAARAADPIHAWYAALVHVFAYPRDGFEIYGVLRDVFGISDDALARYLAETRSADGVHALRLDQPPPPASGPVGEALAGLHAVHREVAAQPLYDAVETILRETRLPERLATAPLVETDRIAPVLETLRKEAATAEEDQEDLVGWADRQRRALEETLEEQGSSESAITLLTAHKAKGLGFDAVLVPFFFRRFSTPPQRYPCFEKYAGGTPRVLFDGDDRDADVREGGGRRRRELHERLLYVALTRVKRTLVLFDDAKWWSDLKNQQGECWAELLQAEDEAGGNRGAWLRWPAALVPPPDPADTEPEAVGPASTVATAVPEGGPDAFWRRVTPSSLQVHGAPARAEPGELTDERFFEEVRERALLEPAAYGNWWHEAMEDAPWSEGRAAFQAHCRHALETCPDRSRGEVEFQRLLASPLCAELLDADWAVSCEVPFLWGSAPDQVAYEGFIDLLAVHRPSGAWRVVDWKTDRMPGPDPARALREAYLPQLAVYARAVAAGLGPEGSSGLYSTVTGEWLERPAES